MKAFLSVILLFGAVAVAMAADNTIGNRIAGRFIVDKTLAATDVECVGIAKEIKADTMALGTMINDTAGKTMTPTELATYSDDFYQLRSTVDIENAVWDMRCITTAPAAPAVW